MTIDNSKLPPAPAFRNQENPEIGIPGTDKTFFYSRSVAVCALVRGLCLGTLTNILLTRRGPDMDDTGKWCMPCGYLDWNESLVDCVRREVWEETGLLIRPRDLNLWRINDDPSKLKQNITFHFHSDFVDMEAPLREPDGKEVMEILWVPLDHIKKMKPEQFAFNHWEIITKIFTSETTLKDLI